MKISPTVGRVVWFRPPVDSIMRPAGFTCHDPRQPCAAQIVYVWNESCVNLSVLDHNGEQYSFTSVPLVQEDEPKPEGGFFCAWMPYQVGQAKAQAPTG